MERIEQVKSTLINGDLAEDSVVGVAEAGVLDCGGPEGAAERGEPVRVDAPGGEVGDDGGELGRVLDCGVSAS